MVKRDRVGETHSFELGQVVSIRWLDHANHTVEWFDKAPVKVATIVSHGQVSAVRKHAVTLIQSVCTKGPGEGSMCNAITIIRSCITGVDVLSDPQEAS